MNEVGTLDLPMATSNESKMPAFVRFWRKLEQGRIGWICLNQSYSASVSLTPNA
jgi:hypothetical protein